MTDAHDIEPTGGADAPATLPYGSWPSTITVGDLTSATIGLAEPWLDGDDAYWIEARPAEGGRRVLVRQTPDGAIEELTPTPANVRTRVHEYGGGSYTVAGGTVVYSEFRDGRLYRLDPGIAAPTPITPAGPYRYADLRVDAPRRRFLAVREDHTDATVQPRAAIVAIAIDGDRDPVVLYEGPDFIAAPRPSPDGNRLAWLEWDHPDMPWDATRLRIADIAEDGTLGISALVAGAPGESIVQPEWSAEGLLHFVSDRTGWWNLYRLAVGPRLEPLAPREAEFADPAWVFDRSSYAFLADGSIVATPRAGGHDRLVHITPGVAIGDVDAGFTEYEGLRASTGTVIVRAGSPTSPPAIVRLDAQTLEPAGVLRRATDVPPDPDMLSTPEAIVFPSAGRTAHALFYPPRNATSTGPDGERPPLLVLSHGGPTSNAQSSLDLEVQLFTSRGIAVVDVDYAGSSGYGRAYRRALDGQWGIADVDDCEAAARFLVERGDVDPERLAIMGGSAGGFTTLAALAFRDTFSAGISLYGVGDLETLAGDTHKFEARYMDRLIGPYPDAAATYRERSPVHALERIACPVLVVQGLDDRVVPPSQAEAIVAALAARGIPHAYLAFEGEGHGLRGAEALRGSVEAQLAFLGAVFGFTPADDIAPLELPGLDAWRAARRRRPDRPDRPDRPA